MARNGPASKAMQRMILSLSFVIGAALLHPSVLLAGEPDPGWRWYFAGGEDGALLNRSARGVFDTGNATIFRSGIGFNIKFELDDIDARSIPVEFKGWVDREGLIRGTMYGLGLELYMWRDWVGQTRQYQISPTCLFEEINFDFSDYVLTLYRWTGDCQ